MVVLSLVLNLDQESQSCEILWSLQRWWRETAGIFQAALNVNNAKKHERHKVTFHEATKTFSSSHTREVLVVFGCNFMVTDSRT